MMNPVCKPFSGGFHAQLIPQRPEYPARLAAYITLGRRSKAIPKPPHRLSTTVKIKSLDHLVLTVASISRSVAFYQRVLAFEPREFKPGRYSLHFGTQKINLHEVGNIVDKNVRHATPGSADLCFLTETPIEEVLQWLCEQSVPIVQGPVRATGACRTLLSVYFYDPDENLIEVSNEV